MFIVGRYPPFASIGCCIVARAIERDLVPWYWICSKQVDNLCQRTLLICDSECVPTVSACKQLHCCFLGVCARIGCRIDHCFVQRRIEHKITEAWPCRGLPLPPGTVPVVSFHPRCCSLQDIFLRCIIVCVQMPPSPACHQPPRCMPLPGPPAAS